MANKPIYQLVPAADVQPNDLIPFHQNGAAKKVSGQTLINFLLRQIDGHGGIHAIEPAGSNGLTDTYRITLADLTAYDFTVTNGRGITSIAKTGTNGLVDAYKISFNDATSFSYTVTNGAKGDKGDNAYIHIKFASQEPTAASHSIGDIPDAWVGWYWGPLADAPSDWQLYKWYRQRGDQGDTGDPATLVSSETVYQTSTSGKVPPSGVWTADIPAVPQGGYLWTRTTKTFNTGNPVVSYSVSRFGIDGKGAVASVCGVDPTPDGDVALTAKDVGAVSLTTYTANLNTIWEPAPDGGYMQSAAVVGILETDMPRYSVDLSGLTLAQTNAAIDGFSEIYRLTTADGVVTCYSYRELSTALRIHLEVFR